MRRDSNSSKDEEDKGEEKEEGKTRRKKNKRRGGKRKEREGEREGRRYRVDCEHVNALKEFRGDLNDLCKTRQRVDHHNSI